ncbi:MAG: MCP four helix bundle domain-containing protein [Propionivibrio sp.]
MLKPTISTRILLMIAASVLALLVVGAVGLFVAAKGADSIEQINDDNLAAVESLGAIRQTFMQARTHMYALLLNNDDKQLQALEKALQTNTAQIEKLVEDYEKRHAADAGAQQLLEADRQHLKAYFAYFNAQLLPRLRNFENEYAYQLFSTLAAPLGTKTLKGLDEHVAYQAEQAAKATASALLRAGQGQVAVLGAIALGVAAVAILGWFLLISIKSSLTQIRTMVDRVESDLDFTVRVAHSRPDEIGQTTAALNRLLE